MSYYVDKRINEVVKDLDTSFLAPELFYEYLNSGSENVVIETWSGTGSCNILEISYNPKVIVSMIDLFDVRTKAFEENGFKPMNLISYAAPPTVFREQIESF